MELCRPESETLESPRSKVLDQDVGVAHEPAQHLCVGFRLHVEGNGPLVPVDQLPPQTLAVTGVAPRQVAQAVTTVGTLDLDHICAEVGEIPRTVGTGEHHRQINYTQTT